ncbi:MAG TPA: hypothetical protein VLC53_02735, partial [Myxococcota bacterium]|nr:hypothetical protein [Myxococcota bacterium]
EGDVTLGVATYAAPGIASVTVEAPPPGSRWLLALATDADGNTSEFSTAVAYSANREPLIFADSFED